MNRAPICRLLSTSSRALQTESNNPLPRRTQSKHWATKKSTPDTSTTAIDQSVDDLKRTHKQTAETTEQNIHFSFVRRFNDGDTYDPFDFSLTKLRLDREADHPKVDKFKRSKFDAIKMWKYPMELSNYITNNGKIIPGYQNGFNKKTQKRVAKAIRRARAAGLLSPVHKDVGLLPK